MSTIAAIVPLYNGAAYIETAIRSVLDQERPADEIIIVDDGSTDNGPSLVEAMAAGNSKVRLLRKENGGQGSARNYGIAHCSSDLIALLDQDDRVGGQGNRRIGHQVGRGHGRHDRIGCRRDLVIRTLRRTLARSRGLFSRCRCLTRHSARYPPGIPRQVSRFRGYLPTHPDRHQPQTSEEES